MSRKYRFGNQDHLHYVTFTVINWIDFFIRNEYRDILIGSIKHCQQHKGLEVYGYCLMPGHFHMIIGKNGNMKLGEIVRDLKSFTSYSYHNILEKKNDLGESRREWMLWMMKRAGIRNSNNYDFQFWQQNNHPVEIWTHDVFYQKLDYIH
jgi:putative transposase